jgi:hypothetical protein
VPVDDQLAAVLALDLEDPVVLRPVDVDVGCRERPVERLADRGQRGVGNGDELRVGGHDGSLSGGRRHARGA